MLYKLIDFVNDLDPAQTEPGCKPRCSAAARPHPERSLREQVMVQAAAE